MLSCRHIKCVLLRFLWMYLLSCMLQATFSLSKSSIYFRRAFNCVQFTSINRSNFCVCVCVMHIFKKEISFPVNNTFKSMSHQLIWISYDIKSAASDKSEIISIVSTSTFKIYTFILYFSLIYLFIPFCKSSTLVYHIS